MELPSSAAAAAAASAVRLAPVWLSGRRNSPRPLAGGGEGGAQVPDLRPDSRAQILFGPLVDRRMTFRTSVSEGWENAVWVFVHCNQRIV